ncbi:DUF2637 domain-containing protein [Streptomyces sp. NPDC001661]
MQARITSWDRAAIVALGGAGCALSYDALQQMATAIHIRGILTFVFPLVIDGFIAYGVRALLVLRTAPLAARCYVWLLFGTATAASIWANALHAVRLNQQHRGGVDLSLGDVTVGILSTLAPLALAGAVHLYILIARRVVEMELGETPKDQSADGEQATIACQDGPPTAALLTARHPVPSTDRPAVTQSPDKRSSSAKQVSGDVGDTERDQHDQAADLPGSQCTRSRPVTPLHLPKPRAVSSESHRPNHTDTADQKATVPTDDDLLAIARPAVKASGRLTRQVVGDAIRSHHGLGNDRLTHLMRLLREESQQRVTA